MADDESFVDRMKKFTRRSHAFSDKLISAKLALSMNSDEVWSEGLLVFYEIFKFLENAMIERRDENIGRLMIEGLARSEALEEDLRVFLGGNWRLSYQVRDSVAEYLAHLQNLLDTDSDMLIPYVYHLYMGLMSGAQLLKRKREIQNLFMPVEPQPGEAFTNFGDHKISDLKKQLKAVINSVAENIDEEKKAEMIKEGNKVFELNDSLVKSIKSSNAVLADRGVFFGIGLFAMFIVYCLLSN